MEGYNRESTQQSSNNLNAKKRAANRRKASQNKKAKTENNSVYVHAFDNKEAIDRGKAWDKIRVDKEHSYIPISGCSNPAAEAALYNESELSVSCIMHGIFADALVQIEELLQPGESAPKFTVALGTKDAITDMPGNEVEMEYPTKKQFKWYHRVPV